MTWIDNAVKHGGSCPHAQRSLDEGQGMGRLKHYIKKMKERMERCLRLLIIDFEVCLDLELSCDIPLLSWVV